jgi:hypothetical protein
VPAIALLFVAEAHPGRYVLQKPGV